MTLADLPKTPSWLTEACPTWCRAAHRESDLPDDRVHASGGRLVPVVVAIHSPGAESPRATELLVMSYRRVGDIDTWLSVREPEAMEQRLLVSQESATRLVQAMTGVLTGDTRNAD